MEGSSTGGNGEEYLNYNYDVTKTLGHGSCGKVKLAHHKLTRCKVAIKIIEKNKKTDQNVGREISILKILRHPHIIRFYEAIESEKFFYIVMEYADSGDLYDYILLKQRLAEGEARHIFQQIISGIGYCHRNKVVHRDIKSENVLLGSDGSIKIIDFGFGNFMRDDYLFRTSCGSINYASPEIVSNKRYVGPEVDVWSCGVTLFTLLCGFLPFDDENQTILFKKIKAGQHATIPSYVSTSANDLLSKIFVVDPKKRLTIPEIGMHPWFQASLPPYLDISPSYTVHRVKKIHEDILNEVVKIGFDRNLLVQSLCLTLQNEATVAYHLLLDKLEAKFQETMLSTGNTPTSGTGLVTYSPVDYKWALEVQCCGHPHETMMEVSKTLQELDVYWEKIGDFTMKCRWLIDSTGYSQYMLQNPMQAIHRFRNEVDFTELDNTVGKSLNALKFEVQLYNTGDENKYILQFRRVVGPEHLFFNLSAAFVAKLRVI